MNNLPYDLQRLIWVHMYSSVVEELNKRYDNISFVLMQFEAMGATVRNRDEEHSRLLCSDRYYKIWAKDIGSWCCEVVN